ncbi:hypothetical protein [Thermosipho atlanticus]|uniref:Uncharacterized protein n=1 Tax=Thermosipho atlanticus DSM 15807 TaxID=1123380 RepID=A0A1M5T8G5_9BACT|nr:hypothetical protein [Thermosipho atlanticus]SHH47004.1 hypothetical protein SAMN02745199_1221 [Thermosipho atlanticus DSM 15807]
MTPALDIQTLITVFFIIIFVLSIISKVFIRRKAGVNIGKIISSIVSLTIGIIFFFTFFSLFSRFTLEFYPPLYGLDVLFKVFISIIPALIIFSILFSIFKNITHQTRRNVEAELKNVGLDEETIAAFRKLGLSPNMSYTQANMLFYQKVKEINENSKLALKDKERLLKELDKAFDKVTEYYKNK